MPRLIIPNSSPQSTPETINSSHPSPASSSPLSSALSSPLSSAISSPQYPFTSTSTSPALSKKGSPLCVKYDCPISHLHHEGPYFHRGYLPKEKSTPFGNSNPPPIVWEAAKRIRDWVADHEDDLEFCAFLRYHGPTTEEETGWEETWRIRMPKILRKDQEEMCGKYMQWSESFMRGS